MVHIPQEKRQKLDAKSHELIFVGYSPSAKGYRFIDPKSKQAITSRNVVFLEATVSPKMIINNSAPEKEKQIVSDKNKQEVIEKKIRNDKSQHLPLSKKVYLPFSEPDVNKATQDQKESSNAGENDDSTEETLHNNSVASASSTSQYSDPFDESYVPEEESSSSYLPDDSIPVIRYNLRPKRREEIYVTDSPSDECIDITDASLICMNGETTMGLLDKDPRSLSEALASNKADKWIQAMKEEYNSLLVNNTWTLVDVPNNKKIIPCK